MARTSKIACNLGYDGTNGGYRYGVGSWSTNQTTFGNIGGTANYCSFLRFPKVFIPAGATITTAYVRYNDATGHAVDTCNAMVYCVAADNPAAPTDAATYDALATTTGFAWNAVEHCDAGSWYSTPSLVNDLQEVIDRPGWAEGQAVIVLFKDNSSSSGAFRQIGPGGETSNSPTLIVEFTHDTEARYTMLADTDMAWRTAGFDGSPTNFYLGDVGGTEYNTYLRFDVVDILKGSTVSAASIWSMPQAGRTDNVAITISCNDHDDSVAPADGAAFDALVLTTANVAYTISADTTTNIANNVLTGFHLALQEVFGRAGWVEGQAVGIIIVSADNGVGVYQQFFGTDTVTNDGDSGFIIYGPTLSFTFEDPAASVPYITNWYDTLGTDIIDPTIGPSAGFYPNVDTIEELAAAINAVSSVNAPTLSRGTSEALAIVINAKISTNSPALDRGTGELMAALTAASLTTSATLSRGAAVPPGEVLAAVIGAVSSVNAPTLLHPGVAEALAAVINAILSFYGTQSWYDDVRVDFTDTAASVWLNMGLSGPVLHVRYTREGLTTQYFSLYPYVIPVEMTPDIVAKSLYPYIEVESIEPNEGDE